MRLKLTVLPFLLLMAVAIVSIANAKGSKESEHVTITDPVMVAGTQLKTGDYRVTWDGTGPVVQVTFTRNGKVAITTPASLVNEESAYDGALRMKTMSGDVKVLEGIQWKKKALVFDQSAPGS